MKNKFNKIKINFLETFFNSKAERFFDFFYFFVAIIFFLALWNEIIKQISLTKIFIIFIIFSFLYFLIKYKKNNFWKNSFWYNNFLKKYNNEIFYFSFLIFSLIFLFSFFFPIFSNILKYYFFTFLWIYIILKFFGFKINYDFWKKTIWKFNFFSLDFLQISIIIISFLVIIFYKDFTNYFPEKVNIIQKNTIKVENKKSDEEILEEKLKKLADEVNAKNKTFFEKKDLEEENFQAKNIFKKDLYPWTINMEEEIKNLQIFLEKWWFFNWEINGIYNENLKKSLKKYLIKKCDWPETTKWYFWPEARKCLNGN